MFIFSLCYVQISDQDFSILLEYVQDLKGKARQVKQGYCI
jgi:hypothetical protein